MEADDKIYDIERVATLRWPFDGENQKYLYKVNIKGRWYYCTMGYGGTVVLGPQVPDCPPATDRLVNITINGRKHQVPQGKLTYETIVSLAYGPTANTTNVWSITYCTRVNSLQCGGIVNYQSHIAISYAAHNHNLNISCYDTSLA